MSNSTSNFETQILVTRGDELPKKNYEKKIHPTYETSIRIKNIANNTRTAPHVVIKFFDEYRALSDNLLKYGVGEPPAAPGKAKERIVVPIEAKFPPSHKISSMGVSLSEDQLQQRCFMLNKWMNAVFNSYAFMPNDAQEMLSDFLSLDDDDKDSEANKELILALLKKKKENAYQAAPKPPLSSANSTNLGKSSSASNLSSTSTSPPLPQPPVSTSTAKSTSFMREGSVNSGNAAGTGAAAIVKQGSTMRKASLDSVGEGTTVDAQPDALLIVQQDEKDEDLSGIVLPAEDMQGGFSKETVIGGGFLAVSVLRGDMIPKEGENGKKLHVSYETIIRMLALKDAAISADQKSEVDDVKYAQQQALTPPVSVGKVFDAYRTLKNNLEAHGIYSRDSVPSDTSGGAVSSSSSATSATTTATGTGANKVKGPVVFVVDAAFPRTYKRSAFGMKLSDAQLTQRVILLNAWVGQVLKYFPKYTPEGQEALVNFFALDIDNPAEPHNKRVLAMLMNLYQPDKKPTREEIAAEEARNKKNKNHNKNNHKKNSSSAAGKSSVGGREGEEAGGEADPGQQAACCTIS